MKYVMFALLALTGAVASANGLDAKQYTYEDVVNFAPVASTCDNGDKQDFVESINGLDKKVNVSRVCVDGSFYTHTTTVGLGCEEGATAAWESSNSINDHAPTAQYVCSGGKYILQ
jgi:hypothetical protein